ncbi:MAG: 1,4-dihydroxy-6-naphthoate synthase [Ginsengibacter sp.]
MKYTLGFSPCPNDTFIFDALVNHKIETDNIEFDVRLEDVQTLNEMALRGELDFSKISYGVLPKIIHQYKVLNSGSALGKGVGPLLISKDLVEFDDVDKQVVAIPGENTTAHLLFTVAFPNAKNKVFKRYDEIENFVLSSKENLGVIIHENRFTYEAKGLHKIVDLGNYWEEKTGYPIPLGGIVAHKRISGKTVSDVDMLIKKSIEFSFSNYPSLSQYVKDHAQEMDTEVMKKHIDLYVNDYSLDLGTDGKAAIRYLADVLTSTDKKQSVNVQSQVEMFV